MSRFEMALTAARAVVLAAEMSLLGALLVQAWIGRFRLRAVLRPAFVALLVAGPIWVVLQAAEMVETTSVAATFAVLPTVLFETRVGHVALARLVLFGLAMLLARTPRLAAVPALIGMALHAGSGHAAASDDTPLLAAAMLHVTAAGAWLGGLVPLVLAMRNGDAARATRRFSWLGLACVLVLVVSALVQANALLGGFPGLVGTAYGHAILLKLVLLAGLLGLAALNRQILAPAITAEPASRRPLYRNVAIEIGLGLVLVVTAATLAGLPPGAHEQPWWPFPWRISLDALVDEEIRAEIRSALLSLVAACGLVLLASWRRWRIPGLAAAAIVVWLTLPHLDVLLVPAEPTYFYTSPAASTPASIALGAAAYRANCVSCHGTGGEGDGPLAAGLSIPPADLTAPHLWDHPDGQLFWWLTAGMAGPDGKPVMPGYASLDETTRWALIDFLHANNATQGPAEGGAVHHH